uniref:Uncharacterized protein n=1 Tax=Strongyloides venezuelensis TaxID=75913 RepID=A0A0K0FAV8_STRVS
MYSDILKMFFTKKFTLLHSNGAGIAVRENEMIPSIVEKLLKMQENDDKIDQELASLIFKMRYPKTAKKSQIHKNTLKNNRDKAKLN